MVKDDWKINFLLTLVMGILIGMSIPEIIIRGKPKDTRLERMEKQLDRLIEIHTQGHVIVTPELKVNPTITNPLPKIDEDIPHVENIPHVH